VDVVDGYIPVDPDLAKTKVRRRVLSNAPSVTAWLANRRPGRG